jgi:hypothetical protein
VRYLGDEEDSGFFSATSFVVIALLVIDILLSRAVLAGCCFNNDCSAS